jgi:predicted permease
MKFLRRLNYLMHRRKLDAELAEELEFHRSQSGAAELGNRTLAREDARAVWIWPWLESVAQDLRYAVRNLKRQPGFSLLALLTLGLAIGMNTSLFTVFDAVALRRWPVQDPSRLVKLLLQPLGRSKMHGYSLAEYRYIRDHAQSFSGVVAMTDGRARLGFEPFGKVSYPSFVSGNYFSVLGAPLDRGRGFLPEEDDLDAPQNVAVLSYAVWRDHYGSDPQMVGKQIKLDDVPFTVVGVAAEIFTGTTGGHEDLYIPLAAWQSLKPNDPQTRDFLRKPDFCCTPLAARLAPGVPLARAQAELEVLSRQFHHESKLDPARVSLAQATVLAGSAKQKDFMPVFALMFVAVTLVLLLACANVSNLLLARAAARQREIEVRRALGAGRARIVRQLLTEGFVLALGACGLGLLLAVRLPSLIFEIAGEGPNLSLRSDYRVVLYAILAGAFACVAFALAPALAGTGRNASRPRLRMRSVLLAAQVAMSVVLLIGAGLMIAGVQHARTHDPGFRVNDVSVISFEMPASAYDPKRTAIFLAQLLNSLESSPELQPVGVAARAPLSNGHWFTSFRLPSEPATTDHDIEYVDVTAGYFDVLGVPLIAGRNFQSGDAARHAVIVNETMAKRYFDLPNPVGKTIVIGKTTHEIVGVARDAYLTFLEGVGPLLFQPFGGDQVPQLLVRSNSPGAADAVAGIAKRIDSRTRTQATPLAANLDRQLDGSKTMAGVAGALGGFALLLAVIGMSGVFAYVVQQRSKEIGIRMALGAEPKQVIGLVLAGTARAAIIGLAIGYIAAAGAAKLLAEYLYGVSPYDPRAYFEVAAILAISALAAAYLPARRATRVDPLTALRVE